MRGKDKTQFLNKMKVSLDANMFNQTLDKMTDDGLVNYHDKLTRQINNKRQSVIMRHTAPTIQQMIDIIKARIDIKDLKPFHPYYKGVQTKFKYMGIGKGTPIDLTNCRNAR